MITNLFSGYRRFCGAWWREHLNPKTYTRWVRWMYQRATRGYADCDVWSIDDYLNSWLPSALRDLKGTAHPCLGNGVCPSDCDCDTQWDAKLETMALGFEASQRLNDLAWDDECGPNPDRECIERWTAKEEVTRKAGFALFAEYYRGLWN